MAMTTIGDLSWDQTAYNKLLYFAFNEVNVFDRIASVKPTEATHDGATTMFFKAANLTPTSTALDESTDVTPETLDDDTVLVSSFEYGKAVRTTQLLRLISIVPVIPSVGRLLGVNAAESVDYIALAKGVTQGTNVLYAGKGLAGGTRNTLTVANKLTANDVRLARNRLRRKAVPMPGGLYDFHLHSDVLFDLLTETGSLGWTELTKYTSTDSIRTFDIGVFNSFRFVETAHAPVLSDAGSSPATTDVYQSFATGFEALAKSYSSREGYGEMPQTVMSPTTDSLRRFLGWGWKHYVGYGVFRDESLWRIESASTIGANA